MVGETFYLSGDEPKSFYRDIQETCKVYGYDENGDEI